MRPPRARTWAPRGHTPAIRVRQGGTGPVPAAGPTCCRPGFRTRLICRYRECHGRKGETRAFTWPEYRDLVTAAHRQLPGGKIILTRDNLSTRAQAEKLALGSRPWLRIFRLPPYAPDLNPVEGIWSVLKRGQPASLSCPAFGDLVQVIQHGIRKIQRRPRLLEGCLAETGLTLETDATDIMN